MRILVVGGGGREHALVWKLAQSPKVTGIYCAPGNPGIAGLASCVGIAAEDVSGLLDFACSNSIDLTVIGPEAPLVAGIVDRFQQAGLRIFGPSQRAAAIEGSKDLAKSLMQKFGVPTAKYETFTDPREARDYILSQGAPLVVKADGLAAGKGVVVALEVQAALDAVAMIMEQQAFGPAGSKVVIEEFLEGEEVSVLAFSDGATVVPMVSAQDHKRIGDGDTGPNTGGMGAYSPAPAYTAEIQRIVEDQVLQRMIDGLAAEGCPYKGVLYAGLMLTREGPKVLEFNARFGDPETQPVMMRLESDLVEIMEAVCEGKLKAEMVRWSPEAAVCVVLASGGYPGNYDKGKVIVGLDHVSPEVVVFHAGTSAEHERIVTDGGRVLGVTALGANIPEARDNVYRAVDQINFDRMHYRKDIGQKALKYLG